METKYVAQYSKKKHRKREMEKVQEQKIREMEENPNGHVFGLDDTAFVSKKMQLCHH